MKVTAELTPKMSWRKSSTASNDTSAGSASSQKGVISKPSYPYALALRIRVAQIICGITEVVMGSVAAIEERDQINLSLGVPTGVITVLAAGWSIHRSVHREACGKRCGACCSKILWALTSSLQAALSTLALRTAVLRIQHGENHTSDTSLWLSIIQGVLSLSTLVACVLAFRMRCTYGSAPPLPGHNRQYCPRSTSHTGVSMVPLTSAINYPAINDLYNKSVDNLSSDNETLEVNLESKPNSCEPSTPQLKIPKSENVKNLAFKNESNLSKTKDAKSESVKFVMSDLEQLKKDSVSVVSEKPLKENGNVNVDKMNDTVI